MAAYKSGTAVEREARRAQEAELYARGYSQTAIAEAVGVSQATVSSDLSGIIRKWQAQQVGDINARRQAELERVNALELAYWAAWDRSVITFTPPATDDIAEPATLVAAGDPRFLAGVMACIDKRCKLLGLDAPVKSEVTVTDPFAQIPADRQAELVDQANRSRASLRCLDGGAVG